jgi:Arc/MetJ-type ribon-helix-helix transcriptional regulator
MRTTINISIPYDLGLFIRERVETGAFTSTSEYIRKLVREDYANCGGRTRERPKLSGPRRANDTIAEYLSSRDEY